MFNFKNIAINNFLWNPHIESQTFVNIENFRGCIITIILVDSCWIKNVDIDHDFSYIQEYRLNGYTALDLAKREGHSDIIKMLKDAGAPCNKTCS